MMVALGCSGSSDVTDAGVDQGAPDLAAPCAGSGACSNIKHVVVIVQENKTFDTYFGKYCTAQTGSNPTCNTGPSCCEAAPATDPGTGMSPKVLDDAENAAFDPNHLQACETSEIDGGKMDKFISSTAVSQCGDAKNFAYADPAGPIAPYINFAKNYAIGDRYFQPVAGQSSSNDMYLARAGFVFLDNTYEPTAIGNQCASNSNLKNFTDPTIGDLLNTAGVTWTWYAGGYQDMLDARNSDGGARCPKIPSACTVGLPFWPCLYDASDVPFQYYPSLQDNPKYFKDDTQLMTDIAGNTLPAVSFVKPIGWKQEHPGFGINLSDGVAYVQSVVMAIHNSAYTDDTLILLTYDEGGGFFDHVAPPPASGVDNQPYGTRVPFIAIGKFARSNFISHVTMEHSSIVKFIEWNFLGGKTGQLGTRDAVVNNIGSVLDPAKTGTTVPEQQ